MTQLYATHSRSDWVGTPQAPQETLEARFALRVTARLTDRARDLHPDVRERLRVATDAALNKARIARTPASAEVMVPAGLGAMALLSRGMGAAWWVRIGSALPVVALLLGLVMIQRWQDSNQISVAAEVDAALLADDLPPSAYSDIGFAEYLKSPGE
jgi:hypothetical protein